MLKSKVEDPERQNWIKESIKIVGQSKNTKEEELFPGLSVTIIYVSVIILNSPIKRYIVRLSSLKKKKKGYMFENNTGDVVFEFFPIPSYEWTKKLK